MLTHPLLPKLRRLNLSAMLLTLDVRAEQASQQSMAPTEFLALLLDDELERRDQERLRRHLPPIWVGGVTPKRPWCTLTLRPLRASIVP